MKPQTVSTSSSSISACLHCGAMMPQNRKDSFCCQGCKTVYEFLNNSELKEFYQLKKQSVQLSPSVPAPSNSGEQYFMWDQSITTREVSLYIEGVSCSACMWLLEKLPEYVPDSVESCSMNLGTNTLSVVLKPGAKISSAALQISKWGYTPHWVRERADVQDQIKTENRKRLLDLGIAGALTGNVMLMSIPLYSGVDGNLQVLFESLSFALSIPALFYSGRIFFKNVYAGIQTKTFPIDAPILLALLVAFFYSAVSFFQGTHLLYFDSLTALIFLLLASRYYLQRLRQKSQMSLGVLDFFRTHFNGKVGDIFVLTPGTIQCDGVIRSGIGFVDASQFTGESTPIQVQAGDTVYAGTILMEANSNLSMEVTAVGENTRLAKLIQQVSDAQAKRTKTELQSDRWAKRLLMFVMSVAAVSLIYFASQGEMVDGLNRVLALLIVTCPCALALATPLVFILATRNLLKKGLLIKDPSALDELPQVQKIFFDKTGTLTLGQLDVQTDLSVLSESELSQLFSLVRLSRHPVSSAIEKIIEKKHAGKLTMIQWDKFSEELGVGVFGILNNKNYSLKKPDQPISGMTEVIFSESENEILRIVVSDQIRPEAKSIVSQLKTLGYQIFILSGDHKRPVSEIAKVVQADGYFSDQSPEQKANVSRQGLMVGDGFNDALPLSSAQVSIAVYGGMEPAIQSAQVYALKPGIAGLVPLVMTSKKVRSTLKQNFILSTSYNLIGAGLSLSGLMSPLIAAILMPLSAVTVFWSSFIRMRETDV